MNIDRVREVIGILHDCGAYGLANRLESAIAEQPRCPSCGSGDRAFRRTLTKGLYESSCGDAWHEGTTKWRAGQLVALKGHGAFIYKLMNPSHIGLWICRQWSWQANAFMSCGSIATEFSEKHYKPWPRVGDWATNVVFKRTFQVADGAEVGAVYVHEANGRQHAITDLEPASPPEQPEPPSSGRYTTGGTYSAEQPQPLFSGTHWGVGAWQDNATDRLARDRDLSRVVERHERELEGLKKSGAN